MIATRNARVKGAHDDPEIIETPNGPVVKWLGVRGSDRVRDRFSADEAGAWLHWTDAARAWQAVGAEPAELKEYIARLQQPEPPAPRPMPERIRGRVLQTIIEDDEFCAALRGLLIEGAA